MTLRVESPHRRDELLNIFVNAISTAGARKYVDVAFSHELTCCQYLPFRNNPFHPFQCSLDLFRDLLVTVLMLEDLLKETLPCTD